MTARAFAYRASITNRPTGGGNKKGGLPSSVGKGIFSLHRGLNRAYGSIAHRQRVFYINQLGWTGGRFYQTRGPSDAVRRR